MCNKDIVARFHVLSLEVWRLYKSLKVFVSFNDTNPRPTESEVRILQVLEKVRKRHVTSLKSAS
jgi:hypothetical protein